MNKIHFHIDTIPSMPILTYVSACGLHYNETYNNKITTDLDKVTCKNCLRSIIYKANLNFKSLKDISSRTKFITIKIEDYKKLKQDKERLDYLDYCCLLLNEQCKTTYKWELIQNRNVNRLLLKNLCSLSGDIDLNDTDYNGFDSCRYAIDEQIIKNKKLINDINNLRTNFVEK